MNPWHRTPAFWLATLATAYCAMAGAWAKQTPARAQRLADLMRSTGDA